LRLQKFLLFKPKKYLRKFLFNRVNPFFLFYSLIIIKKPFKRGKPASRRQAVSASRGGNKNMEDAPKCGVPGCPDCERRELEIKEAEEIAFAFLIALTPMLTITLFSNMGLF
jgi:hypothetical protein